MDNLKLGGLTVTALEAGLSFTLDDGNGSGVLVPEHKLSALRAFIEAHSNEERRLGFRVPLRPLPPETRDALTVTLERRGISAAAQPVDLSLTGILVELPEGDFDGARSITVTLRRDGERARLRARVVRRNGALMALHFPSCVSNGELDPPEELLAIYRSLEQDWLKVRVRD